MKTSTVHHIAKLANIPITEEEAISIQKSFEDTLATIDNLVQVDVEGVESTHQVTGLENIFRDDVVDIERSFSQEEALANAGKTHHGYFVVDRLIEDK